jgi:hypothetical protein
LHRIRGRSFRWILTAAALLPLLSVSLLWWRSYGGYIAVRREHHVLVWPDGRRAERSVSNQFAAAAEMATLYVHIVSVASERGQLKVHFINDRHGRTWWGEPPYRSDWRLRRYRPDERITWPQTRFGVASRVDTHVSGGLSTRCRTFVLDYWLALAISSMLPMLLFGPPTVRRCYRRRKGHCLKCGYDLRASECRCPECGTPILKSVRHLTHQMEATRPRSRA